MHGSGDQVTKEFWMSNPPVDLKNIANCSLSLTSNNLTQDHQIMNNY